MSVDVTNTRFAGLLQAAGARLDDRAGRRLVVRAASRYLDTYPFAELEDALAALELVDGEPARLEDAGAAALADVEDALGEYCVSLNAVAAAMVRLFDAAPLDADAVLACMHHLWGAYACNEAAAEFAAREDAALCELLAASSRA